MAKTKISKVKKNPEAESGLPSDKNPTHRRPLNRRLAYFLLIFGCICLLFALFFTFRTVKFLLRPPHPISRESNVALIEDWMTLPYISRTYQIPEPKLIEALGLKEPPTRSQSLKIIAQKNNLNPDQTIAQIREAITEFQKDHPPRQIRKPLP